MLLSYFTEEAYDKLLNSVGTNKNRYLQKDEWLAEFFRGENYYKTSSVEVRKFTPYYSTGIKTDVQKSEEDLNNTRLMYDAFKELTPLQASNKYMWTYLCHSVPEYREYINDRWMKEQRENTIRTRYFVTGAKSLFDNALSRLWWYGYLTYDKDNTNPYTLTEVLLTNQTICTDFIDTKNSMNKDRAKGVLSAIKEFKEIIDDNEGITEYFRSCNKYMNRYAAVTTMDFLEADEIKKLALDHMLFQRNKKLAKSNLETVQDYFEFTYSTNS